MQLIDKAVDLRGSQVLNVKRYRAILWQRRCMALMTLLTIASIFVFIAALATPDWAIIDFTNTDLEAVHVQLGVWGEWRTKTNHSLGTIEWIPHFPAPPRSVLRLADTDLRHYYRAQMAFGMISLVLMLSNNALAIYTFYHHRYMYKRLVACLHAVIAMCIVVTVEVLTNSVHEWNISVAEQSKNVDWDYSVGQKNGRSAYMAWTCVCVYALAAISFALGSHKQKGSRAATAEFEIEDRPIHIGR
uniref:Ribosomal protein L2 n=1 Tax=Parascaris univalens TaxID=6257 RepID=A0A915AHL7_PARUN